ncbi:MAG TPA: hypothetical protein VMD91_06570 [Candidatus Sulfotelmatobacter sp.]|nr:hypothetical protein [Candidatus Sulfotelmatobacter sp.]
MRVRLVLLAVSLAAAVCAGGCSGSSSSTSAASPAPAPSDPDFSAMMENFYQQIEGKHWSFAYGMLSARYRKRFSEDDFIDRYSTIDSPDVLVRQLGDRSVDVRLTGTDAHDPAQHLAEYEQVSLAWDGAEWVIDDIKRAPN